MPENGSISYVEFAASNLDATKQFFHEVFGWTFQDFGPDYSAFSQTGLEGGFYRANLAANAAAGSALIVLYGSDLEQMQAAIEQAGGTISKPIFTFPGGRRFHFCEPSGNELAVWSDQ